MKKSNETNGNQTRDLLACKAVPQPTAPPRAPGRRVGMEKGTKVKKQERREENDTLFNPYPANVENMVSS